MLNIPANIGVLLNRLQANGYRTHEPNKLTESVYKEYLGMVWLTANSDAREQSLSMIFNDTSGEIKGLIVNVFEFAIRNGFSESQLEQLTNKFADAKLKIKRIEKRRGILPFFSVTEETIWTFADGSTLSLHGAEDKTTEVKIKEVTHILG